MRPHPSLEHRAFLRHPPGFHPFQGSGLFERIGGQASVDRLVDALYDRFEHDAHLRPLFGRDLTHERQNQKRFFAEWLGGPRRNSDTSYTVLQHQHDGLPITRALAGRWLGHFRHALDACGAHADECAAILEQGQSLAFALINQAAETAATGGAPVAWCGVEGRVLGRAADSAARGNLTALRASIAEAPDLARRPTYAAKLLQSAVFAGKLEAVRLLLSVGIDPNKPHYLGPPLASPAFERVLFVTPLCVARMKRRTQVEALLIEYGAQNDIFTAAWLGNRVDLQQHLATDAALAQTSDPATDVLDITPIHHAIAAQHVDAVRLLLAHDSGPLTAGARGLRGAAERDNLALVELLLARGADAKQLAAGRWVLHPRIAPLLAAHGAAIDRSGTWIGLSCTGNHGRKDDPDYVHGLLRYGARADDRRTDDTLQATALHYAAKSGFLRTMTVLLEHGADPSARDTKGRTPLEWIEHAAQSVDRAAVRRVFSAR